MTDITKYEYQDLVDRMTNKLKNADGWGDGYDSSMGQVLIQLVADTTDQLHYMLERRTTESYMFTARTRSAVLQKASERGYHYRRAIGNRGLLELTTSTNATANIIIPKFSEFSYDGNTYISTQQVFIPVGFNKIAIPVVQGTLIQKNITPTDRDADGDYIIEKNYDNIDNNAFLVISDGIELNPVWRDIKRAMSFLSPTDNFYDVRYGFDGMRIIFGNGKFGRAPSGDILLKYVELDQSVEPLITINNEFTNGGDLQDVNGTSYQHTIINTTRIDNGQPEESIDQIKVNAAIEHNSSGRAVSDEDTGYWILESGIGDIVDVNVSGEDAVGTFAYNTNNVFVCYANNSNTELSPVDKQNLRKYLKRISIANPHYVLRKANELNVAIGLSAKKDELLDLSVADYYQFIKQYLETYFSIKRGSIGARYEHSDLIRDLYKLEIERNGIVYKLIDYLRLDIDLLYPFTTPLRNTEVIVKLAGDTPKIQGSQFALALNGVVFNVDILTSDDNITLLQRMRDHIFAASPYLAEVTVGQSSGTFQETYNNTIGGGLILGTNTPMNKNTQMMGNFAIGSNVGTVLIDSPAITLTHVYDGQTTGQEGRKPIIPLAFGSTVSFTAPLNTNIRVYNRTNLNDPSTESLYFTVSSGNTFTDTFENYHSIQLEYIQATSSDVSVTFNYPLIDSGANTGLRIYTRDGHGDFTASKEVGSIPSYVSVLKQVKMPVQASPFNIQPLTAEIVDENNNMLYRATNAGTLISSLNIPSADGFVNYASGVVTVPSELPLNRQFFIKFKQDKFQNVQLDERTLIKLMPFSNSVSTPNPFSFIEVI